MGVTLEIIHREIKEMKDELRLLVNMIKERYGLNDKIYD